LTSSEVSSLYRTASYDARTTTFLSGSNGVQNLCQNSVSKQCNSWLRVRDSSIGYTMVFSRGSITPRHGRLSIIDSIYTIDSNITNPQSIYYTPDRTYQGLDSFSINVTRGSNTITRKIVFNITPLPDLPIITGDSSVCVGSSIRLSSGVSGGLWKYYGERVSVDSIGNVTGLSEGKAIIRYYSPYNVYGCRIGTYDTINVVNSYSIIINGVSSLIHGNSITLQASRVGGIWSKTNDNIDIIGSGRTILINGVNSGRDTIRYSITNACGTVVATKIVNILAHKDVENISIMITNLYPNPNNGKFSLDKNYDYIITDIFGKLVTKNSGKDICIDVPNGVYIIYYSDKQVRFTVQN
jgi:hypothetical protein